MTIRLVDETIVLEGFCGVEEVEGFLRLVTEHPRAAVDLRGAEWAHTALWQVMMMTGAKFVAAEDGSFATVHVVPNLTLENF